MKEINQQVSFEHQLKIDEIIEIVVLDVLFERQVA